MHGPAAGRAEKSTGRAEPGLEIPARAECRPQFAWHVECFGVELHL